MKQYLFLALAAACTTLCVNTYAQSNKSKNTDKSANDGVSQVAMKQKDAMAYTATYSSRFTMGNPAHSTMVMDLIKDYEQNTFLMSSAFADTVMVIFPDGKMVRGVNDMSNAFKQARTSQTDPKISISAVMPVRSTDRKEDWVLVWGGITNGSEKSDFHHIWRINRSGKVDFMQMFQGKSPAQQ